MKDYIEEMMKTARVAPKFTYACTKHVDYEDYAFCYSHNNCRECEYVLVGEEYPEFSSSKQQKLLNLIKTSESYSNLLFLFI